MWRWLLWLLLFLFYLQPWNESYCLIVQRAGQEIPHSLEITAQARGFCWMWFYCFYLFIMSARCLLNLWSFCLSIIWDSKISQNRLPINRNFTQLQKVVQLQREFLICVFLMQNQIHITSHNWAMWKLTLSRNVQDLYVIITSSKCF